MIHPWRLYPHEHARVCHKTSQVPAFAVVQTGCLPRPRPCSPSASTPRFPLCSETGTVERRWRVRMWWTKSGASNWELLTNLVIRTQFRNWGFLQLHQCRLVLKRSSQCGSTENLTEKFEHNSFHDNRLCLQKTPHLSEYSRQDLWLQRNHSDTSSQMNFSELGRKVAVGIVLLPSPVQQNICSGRLSCCYLNQVTCRSLITLCDLRVTTRR